MAGVTPHGLPYPTGTDLVRDGDNAIQALAEALDPMHLIPVMCAVRRVDSATWEAISDGVHVPINVSSIVVNATQVRVAYAGFGITKIHSVQATADEVLAANDIRCGASANAGYTAVQFFAGSSTVPLNPASITAAGANFWFSAWFSK